MGTCPRVLHRLLVQSVRKYSRSTADVKHYKVVVTGGGAGGSAVAARACRAFGPGKVAVVDPAENHYYQPLWTLVGAGVNTLDDTFRSMKDVLPKNCHHLPQTVSEFDPDHNTVTLGNGQKLSYDYLVVALGMQVNVDKNLIVNSGDPDQTAWMCWLVLIYTGYRHVEGLNDAFREDSSVCSIYLPETTEKTFSAIQNFKGGRAVFTYPNSLVKCAGAPQKIMYLADEYWRKQGIRDKAEINFYSSLPKIFGVEKFAASLNKVIARKNIKVNFETSVKAVDHKNKTYVIEKINSNSGPDETHHYDLLHIVPPMGPPDSLRNSPSSFTDSVSGYLDVNRLTMQHNTYPNVFGLGDCTNIPTAKTAAAVGPQNAILFNSLKQVMAGQTPDGQYDGYTACPLVTGYNTCILAEFNFECEPLETFPVDQAKERRTMFFMKKIMFPFVYWNMLVKGRWSGNKYFRKILHLGMSK